MNRRQKLTAAPILALLLLAILICGGAADTLVPTETPEPTEPSGPDG